MATNYPGAVDSLTNPAAGDALNSPSHAAQHANANDAIEAMQTELGTTPSGSETTVAARLAAIEAGTRLGANSVDTNAIADGAATPAKLATTGRFAFPTGAANGYGFTSGASHLSGTGSPEGVVTAAPGSTWLQTDSTTDVKGWIKWVKASGTGSTGWVAGAEADTGWRNVSADVGADFSVSDKILIRRQGSRVTVQLRNVVRVTNSGNRFTPSTVYTLPTGFRHTSYVDFGACYVQTLLGCFSTGGNLDLLAVRSTGTWAANDALWGEGDFLTDDTWPTSLPGVAV